MPTIDLSDEELQGFVILCATASGPGINWTLTNALLNKARMAQEAKADKSGQTALSMGNSKDESHAAIPR